MPDTPHLSPSDPAGQPSPSGPAEPPKPFPWKPLILVAVLGAGGWLGYRAMAKPAPQAAKTAPMVKTVKVVLGTFIRTVRVAGQTTAKNYAAITVPMFKGPDSRRDLTLLKLAKAGLLVKEGEIVAQLDPQSAQDHIDDVSDTVAQAESDIRKRKYEQAVEWENLQQTLREAKASYDKAALDARAAEVKTKIEREILQLSADEAKASFEELQKDIPHKKIVQGAELKILQITYQRQKNHLDRHKNDLRQFVIKAPMSGLVVNQQIFRGGEMGQIQEGDAVSPGQLFMKIVDPRSMELEAYINQSESGDFRIGQPVTVGLDAFPDLQLKGKIYSIGALAAAGGRAGYYIRTIPIRISVEGSDPRLIPDLSGWGNVEKERRENALMIPRESLRSEAGKDFVYVRRGGTFVRQDVELGPTNKTEAVVAAGLNAGDEIALGAIR